MSINPTRRWGSHSIGLTVNPREHWFDFHIVRIPWLGIFRIVLGKLSINMTYPVDLPSE